MPTPQALEDAIRKRLEENPQRGWQQLFAVV